MTNTLKQQIEEILARLPQYDLGQDPITHKPFTVEETFAIHPELKEATTKLLQAFDMVFEESLPRSQHYHNDLDDAINTISNSYKEKRG